MSLNKLGRYDLIRVLGKGAMGLVYEGRDPNLDRRVAIKTIRVENLSDEAAAEYEVRFRTEARSAARLQHPNIVSVYDSDRDLDIAYLVMEFIQGDDLKHHLDKGEVYTLEQTLGIMSDLLSALDYAHRQSIVHRDIKPANLLIEANGRVKLTDFGVARIQDSGEATRTQGSMVGTLKYMSPEQVQGRPVDARADLFAAGIVLHQLLTGKRPFDGESDFAVIQQIVAHHPAAPSYFNPKLPPALDAVLARALAKSRDQRYATAQEFSVALHEASRQASDQTMVPPSSPAGKTTSTWTKTMRAGESLLSTQPGTGLNTNTGTNTGTNTSGSIVTQELELVYWKDIKDSVDVEDIEVFLAKFPTGVYADLARRRLKKLASPSGEGSDIGLGTRTQLISPAGIDPDKTVMMPRRAVETATPASSVPANAVPAATNAAFENVETAWKALEEAAALPADAEAADKADNAEKPFETLTTPAAASASVTPSLAAGKSRRGIWAIAVLVAVACAGLGYKFLSGGPAPDPQLAIAAAASAPAAAASAPEPSASSTALVAAAVTGAASAASAPASASSADVAAASAALAASAPVGSASAAAASKLAMAQAAARRAAAEKDRLARQAPEKNAVQAAPATPALANTPPSPVAERPTAAAVAPTAVATNPRQACEDRVLLGFQLCMRDQCAKPAFVNHPVCVERKAMEQRRRDSEISK